ncbi:MAG: CAP domain-containing protein [Bacteroidota bacterium]
MKKHFQTFLACGLLTASALPLFAQVQIAPPSGNPHGVKGTATILKSKVNTLAAPNATIYSHGDPTDEEQYTLELINRARANPTEEGIRLANTTDPDVTSSYQYFNINTNTVKTQFAGYPSRPPLAFNEKLISAARKHSQWMKDNNTQSHTGANGTSPFQRMNNEGYTGWSNAGENVAAYARSLWHGHAGFNVDWGTQNQIDLGHRENIMNFKNFTYTEIGVGIIHASGGGNQVGPMIITHDFGRRADYFLTGVVFKDNNNNGFYDVGEGVSGVTVTPSKGTFYAITSSSGGYAIPMTNVSGPVSVTASGTGIGGSATKNVSFSGENVKLDFTSALPGNVSLISPANEELLKADSVKFSWMKSANVSKYWFELSEKPDFTTVVKRDSTLSDTTFPFKNLTNGKTYFWRVKAKTTAGWGDFSEANSFTVEIIPDMVELSYPANFIDVGTQTRIGWYKQAGATKYWYEYSTDEFFLENVTSDTNTSDTTALLKALEPGISYFWHVKASNGTYWGEFSETRSFITQLTLPAQVELISPEDGTLDLLDLRFKWIAIPDANFYELEVSEDSTFTNIVFRDSTITQNEIGESTFGTGTGARYFWHVRAKNLDGWGEYSPTWQFTVHGLSVYENAASKFKLENSPNPFEKATAIKFTLLKDQNVTLRIYNAAGQEVFKSVLKDAHEGENSFTWHASGFENGVYYYEIEADNMKGIRPMVLVK